MQAVINRKRYNTDTATLLASDRYWDGSNWERRGRNTYLYRAPGGSYFVHRTTQWQGERDNIEVLDQTAAADLYETLPEQELSFEDAFPGLAIEEA